MIPISILPRLRAPRGLILVLKDTPSVVKAGLYVPPGILETTRTATGTIIASADEDIPLGGRYLLSGGAGRKFFLGYTSAEEVEVVLCSRFDLLAKLDLAVSPELMAEHYARLIEGRSGIHAEEDDGRFAAGDPRGLR